MEHIRQNVSEHTFDVWFKDINLESYDSDRHAVLLSLPHRYVYEYIEEVHACLLKETLDNAFGTSVRINYRLRKELQGAIPVVSFPEAGKIPMFSIDGARGRLEKGLEYYLGAAARWIPCYDKVAEWLSDNKGRGLLCVGTSGLGKTVICEKIIPVILGRKIATVNASDLHSRIDELLKERIVIVDDLGKEPAKIYGQPDTSFYKLCNAAEQRGILLIITTNLATTPVSEANRSAFPLSIQERYGNDVLSRLRATTTVVGFSGDDMRK